MDVFDFSDYRAFLKAYLDQEGHVWGLKSSLAEAAGCQRSFFSQVLSGQASFSMEHAAGIARHLGFDNDQTEHFLDLVSLEKAQGSHLKSILQNRMKRRKQDRENLGRKFGAPTIASTDHQQLYYSSWYWSVIHILTGIEEFQSKTAIAEKLSLPMAVVEQVLKDLERMGLVKHTAGKWENIKGSLHLAKESPMAISHHSQWRQQANLDMQLRSMDSIHYTSLQSISKKDLPKFKKLVVELIDDSRHLVIESGKEDVVCFACDLFVVGN